MSEARSVSNVFSRLVYNPQCFMLYYNRTQPPNRWDDVCTCVHTCTYYVYIMYMYLMTLGFH